MQTTINRMLTATRFTPILKTIRYTNQSIIYSNHQDANAKPSNIDISIFLNSHMSRLSLLTRLCYSFTHAETYRSKPKISVEQFLKMHRLEYTEGGISFKLKYCPFCPKPHNDNRTNLFVLNVHKETGVYHCFRCGLQGSFLQLKERVLGINIQGADNFFDEEKQGKNQNKLSETEYFIHKQNLWHESFKDALDYVKSRGFTEETIKDYNLGAGFEEFYEVDGQKHKVKCLYFPNYKALKKEERKQKLKEEANNSIPDESKQKNFVCFNDWTELVKAKIRGASKQTKKYMRQYPTGAERGFFGLNLIKDSDKTVIITEGQFDAMAVYQKTGIPTLSLPQGATNLPQHLLPYLSRFDKIYLWMDNDQAGNLNKSKIAEKLGLNRTFVVSHNVPKMKDANDFLLSHPEMIQELINKARTIPQSDLTTFQALKERVHNRIYNEAQNRGVQINWLSYFNKKVKGVRMGELTVVSGPTGSGKTTFLSQISLDLCEKGISVLWGSFEIRTEILLTQMINQYSGVNLYKNQDKFEYYSDRFSKLPLYFINLYGSNNIQKVLSTIIYSIQKYNVHVIVIDTLQFLLSEQAEGFKKFELQDTLMARLREISIKFNVHIAIVIHPRKTDDGEDIGIHSIYGTSKATQEADNIWVIQNREGFKLFDIKKNRYDGQLGRIPLGFNREVKQFFQLKKEEFEDLRGKERTMGQIITDRAEEAKVKSKQTEEEKAIFEQEIEDHSLNKGNKANTQNGWQRKN